MPRVLDIGCGSGRVAVPLTGYLCAGFYEGFDVDAEMIAWCRREIGARYTAFGFEVIDVTNTHLQPWRKHGGRGGAFSL